MTYDIRESFEKTRVAGSIAAGALDEVEKIINIKTNNQLNQFSLIYFNKVKKNITIDEI